MVMSSRRTELREPLRLLGREDCHLCEVAQRELDMLGVDYELVDVDGDDALASQYGDVIPVVLLGDVVVIQAPIERKSLREALRRFGVEGVRR